MKLGSSEKNVRDVEERSPISKWPKWTSASAHDREKGLDLSQTT